MNIFLHVIGETVWTKRRANRPWCTLSKIL